MRLCTSSEITVPGGTIVPVSFNKLGNRRFLRFSLPAARTLRIRVSCPISDRDCGGDPRPDPDFVLSQASDVTLVEDGTSTIEELNIAAGAGDYVLEIYDWSHINPAATTRRLRTCMTVTITG
jgi:hypothetical protein